MDSTEHRIQDHPFATEEGQDDVSFLQTQLPSYDQFLYVANLAEITFIDNDHAERMYQFHVRMLEFSNPVPAPDTQEYPGVSQDVNDPPLFSDSSSADSTQPSSIATQTMPASTIQVKAGANSQGKGSRVRKRRGRWTREMLINERTPVCNVYSPSCGNPRPWPEPLFKGAPSKYVHKFECPRCLHKYTRKFSVMAHFANCVARWGNPHSLHWADNIVDRTDISMDDDELKSGLGTRRKG